MTDTGRLISKTCLAYAARENSELRAELSDWKTLTLWGGTPQHVEQFIKAQQSRIHACEGLDRDLEEQCRLLGISGEREAALLAKLEQMEKERAKASKTAMLMDKREKELLESDSIVASCGCGVKTNETTYHKIGCRYRLISERDIMRALLEQIRSPFFSMTRGELCEAINQVLK